MPPQLQNGVQLTYTTPFPSLSSPLLYNGQRSPPRTFQVIPVWLRQQLHRRWLITQTRTAAKENKYLHLWTHLFNISNEQQQQPLFQYLRRLATLRDESEVTVVPMEELADDTIKTNHE